MDPTSSPPPPDILAAWKAFLPNGSSEAMLTASPEWFLLMSSGQPAGNPCHVIRDASGSCVAIFPFLRQAMTLDFRVAGVRLGSPSLRILRVCGGDLIENGVKTESLQEFWAQLFAQYPDVDAVWLDHVGEGRREQLVRESAARQNSCFSSVLQTRQPHYYTRLKAGGEAGARSRNTLRRLARYERALAAQYGEIRYIEIRTEEELLARGVAIEALMNRAWQAEWLGLGADVKAQAPVARAGLLRSWLLEAGGKPVAFLLGYQGNGVVCLHQIGYAQEVAQYSPGTLLLSHVMERLAAADEPLTVDFGSGEAGYKQHFTNATGWSSRIMIVRKTSRFRLMLAAYKVVSCLDSFVRMMLKKLRIKDWLVRKLKRGKPPSP